MHRYRLVIFTIIALSVFSGLFWLSSELTRPIPPTPTITPSPAPTRVGSGNGLIAFTSNRDGNFEIYVMNADGSNQRNLTQNEAWDVNPDWSPDGSQIAFISNRQNPNALEVFVMQADGSNVRQLTQDFGASEALWSPDGTQLLVHQVIQQNTRFVSRLALVQLDGTVRPLALPKEIEDLLCQSPQWLPTGSYISLVCLEYTAALQYLIPVDGGPSLLIVRRAEAFGWSPDGQQLGWIKNWELWLADAVGQNARRVRTNIGGTNPEQLLWSPDGSRLLISVLDGNLQRRLMLMWADGSALTPLPTLSIASAQVVSVSVSREFAWSPDGQWIAYTVVLENIQGLFALSVENAFRDPASLKPIQLTTSGADFGPRWQPQP